MLASEGVERGLVALLLSVFLNESDLRDKRAIISCGHSSIFVYWARKHCLGCLGTRICCLGPASPLCSGSTVSLMSALELVTSGLPGVKRREG